MDGGIDPNQVSFELEFLLPCLQQGLLISIPLILTAIVAPDLDLFYRA